MSTNTYATITVRDAEDKGLELSADFYPKTDLEIDMESASKSWQLIYAITTMIDTQMQEARGDVE